MRRWGWLIRLWISIRKMWEPWLWRARRYSTFANLSMPWSSSPVHWWESLPSFRLSSNNPHFENLQLNISLFSVFLSLFSTLSPCHEIEKFSSNVGLAYKNASKSSWTPFLPARTFLKYVASRPTSGRWGGWPRPRSLAFPTILCKKYITNGITVGQG